MLNVSLHYCKSSTANIVNGSNGPFASVTVVAENGDSFKMYFHDWEPIKDLSECLNIAASGLANLIEVEAIAKEEAE